MLTAAVVVAACGRPKADPSPVDAAWLTSLKSAANAVKTGDLETARREYRLALEALAQNGPPRPRHEATRGLARVEAVSGNLAEAEALYLWSLGHMVDSLGVAKAPKGQLIAALGSLADLNLSMGRPRQAETYFQRILTLRDEGWVSLRPQDMGLAFTVAGMSKVRAALGDTSAADSLSARAMGLRLYAEAYDMYIHDRTEEAESGLRRALSLQIRFLGADHEDTARTAHLLALLLEASSQTEEALVLYRRAVSAYARSGGDRLDHAAALDDLAALLRRLGRTEQTGDLETRAGHLRQAFRTAAGEPGIGIDP